MSKACSTNGVEDNIEIDLGVMVWTRLFWIRIQTSGELL
jgi:hypothetical protein